MQTRRKIGAGSVILVLVTAGLWILAIPFYRQRCPICSGSMFGEVEQGAAVADRVAGYKTRNLLILGILVAIIVISNVRG
ncbi:hypothetical protein ACOTC8_30185 [Achromobacter xylosoxidans]|uniref:hypothetical protein n=1 Tax=Alcaligenes xylosoxydans xylosoxydans TaxID=85698 RepID=UPI00104179D0|nr:hypothetical protein [Achromobacter xylosoxidans]